MPSSEPAPATELIAALGLGQAASAQEGHAHQKQGAGHNEASLRLQKTMAGHQMPTMTGNADQDFASMMIVHHQHAVDMVDFLMKEGRNAELKALGQHFKALDANGDGNISRTEFDAGHKK